MFYELFLFGIFNFIGSLLFVTYFLQRLLAKKTRIIALTIILDLLWCVFAAFVYLYSSVFLTEGQFKLYTFCSFLIGFFMMILTFESLDSLIKLIKKKREKRHTEKRRTVSYKNEMHEKIASFNGQRK